MHGQCEYKIGVEMAKNSCGTGSGMNRVPFYGRGYYTPQMKSSQQNVTTCKLPISAEAEVLIRVALEREGKSIKGMLAEVLEGLLKQPAGGWEPAWFNDGHSWTIAVSKDILAEFKRRCEDSGLDWRSVLASAVRDYSAEHLTATLVEST